MKKAFVLLLAAILSLSSAALAATYTDRDRDLTFEYDDTLFAIVLDEERDDELLVVLSGTDAAWGEATGIRIHLADLDNGERFPAVEDFADMAAATDDGVTQGEWNGYRDVIMYSSTVDEATESVFIVPVYDDDGSEIDDILTITIDISAIGDEEAAQLRDDAISAVLDSLKLIDD